MRDDQATALTAVEEWFAARGLPTFSRRRFHISTRRTSALLVALAAVEVAAVAPSPSWPWWVDVCVLLAVAGVAAGLVAGAVRAETRLRYRTLRRVTAEAAVVLVPAAAAFVLASSVTAALLAVLNLGVLSLLALEQRWRVLPLLRWCVRHAISQVRTAARQLARTVPLLTAVVLALFFTAEVWQASGNLALANLLAAVGVLLGVGVVFAVTQSRSGISTEVQRHSHDELLAGTPAALLSDPGDPAQRPAAPLTRLEELNVHLLLVVSQLCTVAVTAVLFASLMVVLGSIAVPVDVLGSWLGHAPVVLVELDLVVHVVITGELLAMGTLLTGVAGLVFAVSLTGDDSFQDDARAGLALALASAFAVRERYLAAVDDELPVR